MIVLLQILRMLSKEDREDFKNWFEDVGSDFPIEEEIDTLPDFLFNHYGLGIELTNTQKESLVRIINNGNWKAAFNTVNLLGE